MLECEVRTCTVAEIFDDPDAAELIAEYSEECAIGLLGRPAPERERYEGLDGTGFAQCFAARHGGQLCGFAMVRIAVVPHYGMASATVESLFVSRRVRHLGLGTELMHAIEAHARRCECEVIFYTAPVFSRLDLLLNMRPAEYQLTNHVVTKRLG